MYRYLSQYFCVKIKGKALSLVLFRRIHYVLKRGVVFPRVPADGPGAPARVAWVPDIAGRNTSASSEGERSDGICDVHIIA